MAYEEFDEYELKAKIDVKLWFKVFSRLKKYKKSIIMAIIFISAIAVFETLFSFIIAEGIERYIPEKNPGAWNIDTIYQLAIAVGAIAVLQAVSVSTFIFFTGHLELYFYRDLTSEAYRHLQELPFSFYDKNSVGWLLTRVTSDTQKLGEIISWVTVDLVWAATKLIFILVLMLILNWQIALIMVVIVPLMIIVSALLKNKIIAVYRLVRKIGSKITGALNEGITGVKTTKSLALEDKKNQEFKDLTDKAFRLQIKSTLLTAIFYEIIAFATGIAIIATGIIGGNMVFGGTLSIAILFLFFQYMSSFFEPVLNFASISNEMKQAQVAAERVFNLIAVKPEIQDSREIIEKYGDFLNFKKENWEEIKGKIEFDNVSFSYLKDLYILKDFSLKINAGESVAIVGETGAGKSTIVNLICRFYEPTKGLIKIDGKDYRDRSVSWLHHNLGYVLQAPFLFSGTIKENILYGNLDATDEEVIAAAKEIGAHEFISKLENGYDSEVGESGNKLSLGEKQLISFARAIIANPRILVLDEATSSIDTETEFKIQSAINNLMKNRTSIVIAHRLSTIVNCNKILVLQKGIVIESGSHQELLSLKGYYYRLYTNQFIEDKMKEINLVSAKDE